MSSGLPFRVPLVEPNKSGTVEYLGFKFDKSDGEALINIMEKYKDD